MGHYKNYKTVFYCTAQWTSIVPIDEVEREYEFLEGYVGIDKVYLEAYRDCQASREQVMMIKNFFESKGIEVAGGITTMTSDLSKEDKKKQRLYRTFCYSNETMKAHLKKAVEYTASMFDEFIIDDFFFYTCRCEECQKDKGNRSWEQYRLEKMQEVSRDLIIEPARKVNPNVKITIKFPNWRESYMETGYHPGKQRDMFDAIYTGTETRNTYLTDQHLPRYASYSLMRYMDHVAPSRNGGGWFDMYECYSIDTYLEQMYLTVFSRAKEIMHFNWFELYQNIFATPLGLQLRRLDQIFSKIGQPIGMPVYLPYSSSGEDHFEDVLGMLGIPFEPMPEFPEDEPYVFLTAAALKDEKIIDKLKAYVSSGKQAIVTSGFMIGALSRGLGIEEMTSIRYHGGSFCGDEFQVSSGRGYTRYYVNASNTITWPCLEHRTNATWSHMNAGKEESKESILLVDFYGEGKLYTINIPKMFSELKYYPKEALTLLRTTLLGTGRVYVDTNADLSLFTYDNNTFGLYSYITEIPRKLLVHIKGKVKYLHKLEGEVVHEPAYYQNGSDKLKPLYSTNEETIFEVWIAQGEFRFYEMIE